MKRIVLASASPRRSDLLKQIGIEFSVLPSGIEEKITECGKPCDTAKELAMQKAMDIASKVDNDCIVIGADTIVVKDTILGKPADERQAFDMLKALQGGWHEVITGIAVINKSDMKTINICEVTRVKMKELSDKSIHSYIKTGEPMDKAGAYGIQGMGAVLIEKIEGCYSNVVGLPLAKLVSILDKFEINVL